MAAMAFDMGLRKVIVEKRVVFSFCVVELQRVEVQGTFQDAERFVFRENSDRQEVTDVGPKTFDLLAQRRLSPGDLPAVEADGSRRRKARAQVGERGARIGRQFENRIAEG